MKITDVINSLQELNFDLKYEVKNNNELYVRVKSDQIRKIVLICVDLYKFNYICEFSVVENETSASNKEATINCVFSNSKQGY